MKIVLKRAATVTALKAVMEIGEIKKDYDFYLSVLELEEEFKEITPALVNEHLLQRNPHDVIGNRIIKMMVLYRLISTTSGDDKLQLTPKVKVFIQNLRGEKYQSIEDDLRNLLIQDEVIAQDNRGQYRTLGNNRFSLIYDLETNGEIRSNFKNISNFLEHEHYIIPPILRFKMTNIGKEALDRGKVPIAQSSSYIIYTTEDPLFDDNHIIAYEPIHLKEWSRFDEDLAKKPNWLNDLIRSLQESPKIVRLAAQNLDEIYLYGIEGEVFHSNKKSSVIASLTISETNRPELVISREN
jgi:hypothetical protein